ncbi:MAG: SDR family oxidoreductase [Candidatus Omnitrophica bacterium]|nr:SDR family oxidoreductase [Candidatus Omnitrophota bacterium]
MHKKNIIITGGAGFIGSHLCELFLKNDNRVICIDNFITGNVDNVARLFKNKNFELIEHDITKYLDITGRIDYIFHFASPASPVDYLELPIQTLKVGALGTHNALGIAKRKNSVFLLASTSEVYGDPLVHPQSEDYWGNVNPIGPRGVYDEAKRFAEAITLAYHRTHGIDVKIVRIFNTFGPRMRKHDGRAVPAFINQTLHNTPITVFGDGKQTRSFGYIDDLIEGIFKLACSQCNTPVNIGNPNEIKLLQLAQIIKDLTKSKSEIIFQELPIDDPKVRQPDISKAKRILNWEPKVGLEEGLLLTIKWFREKSN